MARTTVKVEGFKDLERQLEELPKNIGRGVARRAVKKAADEMAEEQRRLCPVGDGSLRDSIRVRVTTKNLDGLAEYGLARQEGASARDAGAALRAARREAKASGTQSGHRIAASVGPTEPHAHLVEFGTGERHHKSGKSTGVMPAHPFVRPAFDHGVDQAVFTMKEGLGEEIRRSTARLSKRQFIKGRS
jgi:HK97 gp10 family phage protein